MDQVLCWMFHSILIIPTTLKVIDEKLRLRFYLVQDYSYNQHWSWNPALPAMKTSRFYIADALCLPMCVPDSLPFQSTQAAFNLAPPPRFSISDWWELVSKCPGCLSPRIGTVCCPLWCGSVSLQDETPIGYCSSWLNNAPFIGPFPPLLPCMFQQTKIKSLSQALLLGNRHKDSKK